LEVFEHGVRLFRDRLEIEIKLLDMARA
jgi:hypothetical protein